jgi:succinate dehydrogenase flavin-adding protein (antitoxin of CptAB toxin-antitoxin module)
VEVPVAKPAINPPSDASTRAAAAPAPAAEGEAPPLMQAIMEAMQAPGAREATHSMMRTAMNQMYPDLAVELGLSAEEADQFLDLLASRDDDSMDDAMAVMNGGPPNSAARESMLRQLEESQHAQEAQQSAMLGSRYTKWQDYQHTAAARNEIRELTTLLAPGGNPLTDAQAKELLPVIAAERRRIDQQERDWMTSPAAAQAPNLMQASAQHAIDAQQGLVDVVSKRLTAAQSELYRRKKEQDLRMMRAMMSMFGAGGAPPGSPGGTQP